MGWLEEAIVRWPCSPLVLVNRRGENPRGSWQASRILEEVLQHRTWFGKAWRFHHCHRGARTPFEVSFRYSAIITESNASRVAKPIAWPDAVSVAISIAEPNAVSIAKHVAWPNAASIATLIAEPHPCPTYRHSFSITRQPRNSCGNDRANNYPFRCYSPTNSRPS